MIRYAIILMAAMGTAAAASAFASAHTGKAHVVLAAAHETVVEKNSPFPVLGPLVVQECAKDDCSDVPG